MLKGHKKDIYVFLIFLAIAAIIQVIHYPVGVYDLDADLWVRGGLIATVINSADFAQDPYLSDMGQRHYNTEMYLHAPLLKLFFNNYELYVGFTSFILYFLGMCLLYILVKIITNDMFVSAVASVIFSSSTIWFAPLGDIFSLIPIYAACGRTFSYVYFLSILIIYFRFKDYRHIDIVTVIMCTLMIWIHSLTFLGPAVALICFIFINTLFRREFKRLAILTLLSLIVILPYIVIFFKATAPPEVVAVADKNILLCAFKSDYSSVLSPVSVFRNIEPLLLGTNLLAFGTLIPLHLVLKSSRKQFPQFFAKLSFLVLAITFILRLIGACITHTVDFFVINRNLKWIYFFIFLTFIALYNSLKENSIQPARPKIFRLNYLFAFIILLAFIPPIKDTFVKSNFGNKLLHKIISAAPRYSLGIFEALKSSYQVDLPSYVGIDIRDINQDAEAVAEYIAKHLPANAGLAGPKWINYKIRRSLTFSKTMGFEFYCGMRADKYKRWKMIDRHIESLNNDGLSEERLVDLHRLGVDYILFERFARQEEDKFCKYIPSQSAINSRPIEPSLIEYENDSFLLLKTFKKEDFDEF